MRMEDAAAVCQADRHDVAQHNPREERKAGDFLDNRTLKCISYRIILWAFPLRDRQPQPASRDEAIMTPIRPYQGKAPRIDPSAWIDPCALVIGDVEIGAHSSVWPMAVVRGDVHFIHIGTHTNIQDGSILHVSHDSRFQPGGAPLIIHDRVTVGHQVVLHGCEIHASCLIGIGSRVLDRAVIHAMTLLGAGSLVPPGRVLEGGYLWHGAPVQRIRPLTETEREYLDYSAHHYVRLADRHRDAA